MRLRHPVALFVVLLASSVQAIELIATNSYMTFKGQTIEDELWIVANDTQAGATYQNDIFVSSGTKLLLPGLYEGNLWGMAGTEAQLSGVCMRNVRLASSTLRINGTIDGNLMALANTISISTNALITGDALLIGNQIILEGSINGSLKLSSLRTVTISGKIGSDARVTSPDIILTGNARIQGNLSYTTKKELIPAEGIVGGELKRIAAKNPIKTHAMAFLAALLTGIAFISLFPMTTAMASLLARKSPLKCLLVGFVAAGALPFLGLICLSSLIGFPLGAVILASWGILVYVSRIAMGLMIGTLVLKTGTNSAGRVLLAMATGLVIIYIFTFLPAPVGGIVQFIVIWMGMGALLLALLQKRRLIIQVPEELKQIEALKKAEKNQTEESP